MANRDVAVYKLIARCTTYCTLPCRQPRLTVGTCCAVVPVHIHAAVDHSDHSVSPPWYKYPFQAPVSLSPSNPLHYKNTPPSNKRIPPTQLKFSYTTALLFLQNVQTVYLQVHLWSQRPWPRQALSLPRRPCHPFSVQGRPGDTADYAGEVWEVHLGICAPRYRYGA